MWDSKQAVTAAQERIKNFILETPLYFSSALSKLTQANVYLKCENLQYTGSFKVRGAFNKLLSLPESSREQGIVAASSGNHGAAISYGLSRLNLKGTVFVPENASSAKVANIQNYGATLAFYAQDCMETELYAMDYAKTHQKSYLSPYDDLDVIAGQGTIALEISKQLDKVDAILAPIGGGGLISGIASFIKATKPKTQIFGCMPHHSPVMYESIKAGKIINMVTQPTLSDATAGGIAPGAITFDFCKQYVDDYFLVSEDIIKQAIVTALQTQKLLIEGASGVALGSLIQHAKQFQNKNVVVVLSGANISIDTLKSCIT